MTNPRTEQQQRFIKRYLQPLVGGRIQKVEAVAEDDGPGWADVWPKITVKLASGETVVLEVSRDEEGNGPGFLFGLPAPAQEGADR